ncbi:unnamed protein product [Echinostoma caproni]|uniref:GLE1 RNA export mediator n=1 Tax=Echinostoma caproni TaxID=27848 RepID=A0A183BB81_9TREM|nr:unnamed protein product [Echinostoma caproni]
MDIDVAYHESLLNFNEAARGYERRCAQAKQKIKALLDLDLPRQHILLQKLTLTENLIDSDPIPHSRLNELPPLYTVPSGGVMEDGFYPEELNQAVERIVSIRLEVYQLSTSGYTKCAGNRMSVFVRSIDRLVLIYSTAARYLKTTSELHKDHQVLWEFSAGNVPNVIHFRPARRTFGLCIADCGRRSSTVLNIPNAQKAKELADQSTQLLYPLLSDYNLRKQTLCVKRMVGCACSQVIRSDPAHCLDRMNYLLTFLEGNPVKSSGTVTTLSAETSSSGMISLSELLPDDLGQIYAWQCLFSAAISQAEHQFAYNVDSAITFAALLLGILARHPDKVVNTYLDIWVF